MIAAGHARVLTLLTLTLMDVLPQLVPKTSVSFAGRLNVPVERRIELSNPTKRQITYMVRLDGSDEFAAADKYVVLDAKARGAITITHTARFSQPAASTLYILPATAGERASPLVFALSSTVQANQPAATVLNLSGQLYEVSSIDVPVSLPFDVDTCVLSVSLSERAPAERLGSRGGGWQPPNRGAAGGGGVTSWKGLPAKAFWVKKDRIKVSKKSPGVVTVYFLPTRLAEHICSVNLKDPAHGEMAVDIAASVELPAPSEVLKFSTADKKLVTKELLLAPKNSILDRARAHILEMLGKEEGLRFYREVSEAPPQVYKVQYMNRDVKGPGEVTLGPQNAGGKALGKAGDAEAAAGQEGGAQTKPGGKQAPNRLNVQWDCQGPGQYTAEIVMRSKLDVRVVTVLCSVQPKPVNVDLDLVCPLRQSISQELPVSNRSDKEWAVQARISVEAYGAAAEKLANAFTGSGDFKVPAGQTCSYTLTFRPATLGPVTGKLVLTNLTTNETYSYSLNGVGEEPVAEDHLVVDCAARKPLVFALKVGDFVGASDGDTTYAVQTDLRCISGPPEFVIPRRGLVEYPLQVLSPVGGTFTGAVTFTKLDGGKDKGRGGAADGAQEASSQQSDGNYYWYTVEVRASMPSPERLLAVTAQVRTAVAVAIEVGNPMEQAVTFTVELDGDGLLGDDALSVPAGQTATYEAVYSPLVPTSGTQGAISFVHPELGLFWYQVSGQHSALSCVSVEATRGAHAPSPLNPAPRTLNRKP